MERVVLEGNNNWGSDLEFIDCLKTEYPFLSSTSFTPLSSTHDLYLFLSGNRVFGYDPEIDNLYWFGDSLEDGLTAYSTGPKIGWDKLLRDVNHTNGEVLNYCTGLGSSPLQASLQPHEFDFSSKKVMEHVQDVILNSPLVDMSVKCIAIDNLKIKFKKKMRPLDKYKRLIFYVFDDGTLTIATESTNGNVNYIH